MKLIKLITATFFIGLLFTACNNTTKDDKKSSTDTTATKTTETTSNGSTSKLEGTWEVKREDGDEKGSLGTTYQFKGNNLTLSMEGMDNPGTTEVSDNTFSFLANGGKDKIIYNYHFDGDTLVVQMQDGPQIFHLLKK